MRFAPGIDIISLLVQFLSNFEKSHFLKFSFVGFQHFDARRIFYGCRNGRLLSGTPPNTLGLFPEKKMTEVIRDGSVRSLLFVIFLQKSKMMLFRIF